MLLKHREKIPEVVIGIQQVAAGFEAAGDRLLKSSDLAGANPTVQEWVGHFVRYRI